MASDNSSTAGSRMKRAGMRGTDELTARRVVNAVLAEYRELVADPERLAAVDREVAMFDRRRRALDADRAAYTAGDFTAAERELILAYSREYGDSSVYLTALYRRTGSPLMAEGWLAIAQAEGFSQNDVDTVVRSVPTNPLL